MIATIGPNAAVRNKLHASAMRTDMNTDRTTTDMVMMMAMLEEIE